MKEKVVAHAIGIGIREAEVWSGPEFEERLRRDEPSSCGGSSRGCRSRRPWVRSRR